jgi:hypothetical protein
MSFHETDTGMTHEDIVPLVDRVASHLATARGVSRDQAGILAHKMLHELTDDVRLSSGRSSFLVEERKPKVL